MSLTWSNLSSKKFLTSGGNQVYVCDQHCDLKFQFGQKSRAYGEPGRFNEPSGIAMDARGVMLVGDSRHDRVQVKIKRLN